MSANIYWAPMPKRSKSLSTPAPSRFIQTLEAIGWADGSNLDESHLTSLRGMAVVYGQSGDNPYQQLIDAIEKHGEIRVWAEY